MRNRNLNIEQAKLDKMIPKSQRYREDRFAYKIILRIELNLFKKDGNERKYYVTDLC